MQMLKIVYLDATSFSHTNINVNNHNTSSIPFYRFCYSFFRFSWVMSAIKPNQSSSLIV